MLLLSAYYLKIGHERVQQNRCRNIEKNIICKNDERTNSNPNEIRFQNKLAQAAGIRCCCSIVEDCILPN